MDAALRRALQPAGESVSGCDPELTAAYAEGRLKGAERQKLESHLAGCASCRSSAATLVEEAAPHTPPVPAPWWQGRWRWAVPAMAGFVIVGSAVYYRQEKASPPMGSYAVATRPAAGVAGPPPALVDPPPAPQAASGDLQAATDARQPMPAFNRVAADAVRGKSQVPPAQSEAPPAESVRGGEAEAATLHGRGNAAAPRPKSEALLADSDTSQSRTELGRTEDKAATPRAKSGAESSEAGAFRAAPSDFERADSKSRDRAREPQVKPDAQKAKPDLNNLAEADAVRDKAAASAAKSDVSAKSDIDRAEADGVRGKTAQSAANVGAYGAKAEAPLARSGARAAAPRAPPAGDDLRAKTEVAQGRAEESNKSRQSGQTVASGLEQQPARPPRPSTAPSPVGGAVGALAVAANEARALQQAPLPGGVPLRQQIQSGSRLWAVSDRGRIFRSTDSGQNWTRIPSPTTADLVNVKLDPQTNLLTVEDKQGRQYQVKP